MLVEIDTTIKTNGLYQINKIISYNDVCFKGDRYVEILIVNFLPKLGTFFSK